MVGGFHGNGKEKKIVRFSRLHPPTTSCIPFLATLTTAMFMFRILKRPLKRRLFAILWEGYRIRNIAAVHVRLDSGGDGKWEQL